MEEKELNQEALPPPDDGRTPVPERPDLPDPDDRAVQQPLIDLSAPPSERQSVEGVLGEAGVEIEEVDASTQPGITRAETQANRVEQALSEAGVQVEDVSIPDQGRPPVPGGRVDERSFSELFPDARRPVEVQGWSEHLELQRSIEAKLDTLLSLIQQGAVGGR